MNKQNRPNPPDLVFTVITDVVHADQHRHHLPVLLKVQILEKKLWLILVETKKIKDYLFKKVEL